MTGIGYLPLDTEVELFWDKPVAADQETVYYVNVSGEEKGKAPSTHFTLMGLVPDTEYPVEVYMSVRDAVPVILGSVTVRTTAAKKRIDVTKAPYGAAGDGVTLDTKAIQAAIDACGPDGCVFLPKGTYRTGALDLHSHMELVLDAGARIVGSTDPQDYLPEIPSRFEGTERMCFRSLINLGQLDHTSGANCEDVVIRGLGQNHPETYHGAPGALVMADSTGIAQQDVLASLPEDASAIIGGGMVLARAEGKIEEARLKRELITLVRDEHVAPEDIVIAANGTVMVAGKAASQQKDREGKRQSGVQGECKEAGRNDQDELNLKSVDRAGIGAEAQPEALSPEEEAIWQRAIAGMETPQTMAFRVRGRLINMSNCANIRLTGLTLGYGAAWNLHFIYSDHIVTDHCFIRSDYTWNGDGWDPDSSHDCMLFGCDFYTGDDMVAIKSGHNPEGNRINIPTKNIRIFDCRSWYGNGIVIGSEISGGIEGVYVWDCNMEHSSKGFEVKATAKRGAYVRNVHVRDTRAGRVLIHVVGYNDDGEGAPHPPIIEDCHFEDMYLTASFLDNSHEVLPSPAILLSGFAEPGYELRDIHFKNIRVGSQTTGGAGAADGILVDTYSQSDVDAKGRQLIILKHVKDVSFEGLDIQ